MQSEKKLITYALPYANGDLHLGHMLGMVQADAYVRYLRQDGRTVCFVCGDDAHGTPIMLNAQKQGISAETLIAQVGKDHVADIESFDIKFDHYGSTHDPLNHEIVHAAFARIKAANRINERSISQAYDEQEGMFLPDRFVKGTCPLCGAEDQYGDHCEQCGKTYALKDLKDPRSIVSGQTPVWRDSKHLFYQLSSDQAGAEAWLGQSDIQEAIRNKLSEWFVDGLHDWDITRDAPYFGVEIPGRENQYFYVWLDAPFGYMTSFAQAKGLGSAEAAFAQWNTYQIEHFIGKDIVYFHGVFWPSVLATAGLRQPSKLHVHGFMTLAQQKMSKSRGHIVSPKAFVAHLPSDLMRYYMASRLSDGVSDIDIEWQDFRQKINADVVGKLANMCSRSQRFVQQLNDGMLSEELDDDLLASLYEAHPSLLEAYAQVNLSKVVKITMGLCDLVNQYIDTQKPWALAKADEAGKAVLVASTTMNAFRYIMSCLAPIMPAMSSKVRQGFGDSAVGFYLEPLRSKAVQPFEHLASRVDDAVIKVLSE